MREKFARLVLGFILMSCLVGCGKYEDTEESNDKETSTNSTIVSGSFTVGVRDVIPDYCLDDVTPCVAVVTEFQNYPFTLYVGEEIGSRLKSGEIYVFSIKPIITDYSKEALEKMNLSSIVWELSDFEVVDARLAEDNELGLDSLQLTFSDKIE